MGNNFGNNVKITTVFARILACTFLSEQEKSEREWDETNEKKLRYRTKRFLNNIERTSSQRRAAVVNPQRAWRRRVWMGIYK